MSFGERVAVAWCAACAYSPRQGGHGAAWYVGQGSAGDLAAHVAAHVLHAWGSVDA